MSSFTYLLQEEGRGKEKDERVCTEVEDHQKDIKYEKYI